MELEKHQQSTIVGGTSDRVTSHGQTARFEAGFHFHGILVCLWLPVSFVLIF